MSTAEYDLVVIGSGPAGEKGAAQAAYFGNKVAVIERQKEVGGAAANTGTLPSKTLRETALYLSGFRQRGLYGVNFSLKDKVKASDFMFRERIVVQTERERIRQNLARHHVDLIQGTARFLDAHSLEILSAGQEPRVITSRVFLIASGSHPFHPPGFPFDDPRVFDSDSILNLHDIPDRMLVAGGGVIGCEYACMFAALGIQVWLSEGRDRLLGFLDGELSRALAASMSRVGVQIFMPDQVTEIDSGQSGPLQVRFQSGKHIEVDLLLAATGRSGNTAGLGLESLGIQPDKRGLIPVNEHYQTTLPHIYAAGDVIGFPALASTSMEQARVAMVHAFNLRYKTSLAQILPYGIYTIPEVSMAGETEESLQAAHTPYVVGTARFAQNARGQIIGDKDGFLKLLFHAETMKLLGVHVFGEQASELVHIGVQALLTGAGADLFIQSCFNYPTLSECYKYATYHALGNRAPS